MAGFKAAYGWLAGSMVGVAWTTAAWAAPPSPVAARDGEPSVLDTLLGPAQPAPPGQAARADVGDAETVVPAPVLQPQPPAAEIEAASREVREAFSPDKELLQDPKLRRDLFDRLVEAAADPSAVPAQRWALQDLALELATAAIETDWVRKVLDARAASFAGQDRLGPMLLFLKGAKGAGKGQQIDASLVEAALDLNRTALAAAKQDPERMTIARQAIELAESMLPNLRAADQDRLRGEVRPQREQTDEIAAICDGVAAARQTLADNPDDHAANATLGYAAAWKGDWVAAADHLRRIKDPKLRSAAEKESTLPPAASSDVLYAVASAWWDGLRFDPLAPPPPPRPTPAVQRAIKMHAAHLYRRAIAAGLANPVNKTLAQKRVDEMQENAGDDPGKEDKGDKSLGIVIRPGPAFNEQRFLQVEQQRSNLFRNYRAALSAGRNQTADRLRTDLAAVRATWAGELHLQNRDADLGRKKELIDELLRQDAAFADGWLCDCYLELLAGSADQARASLEKAEKLMNQNPQLQIFSGQQWLDAGQAALVLGDLDGAKKLRQSLANRFPNNDGLRFLGALIDTKRKLLREANAVFTELFRDTKPCPPALAAEYAWFKAANPVERLRDMKESQDAIDVVLAAGQGPIWKALRAQAAVLADEQRWDEAIKVLDQALGQAPLFFAKDIEAQRAAYVGRKPFFF